MADDNQLSKNSFVIPSDKYMLRETNQNPEPAIMWMEDGRYKYGISVEEMLKSEVILVRNFAICIRDAYEAGLRGDTIPREGKL